MPNVVPVRLGTLCPPVNPLSRTLLLAGTLLERLKGACRSKARLRAFRGKALARSPCRPDPLKLAEVETDCKCYFIALFG